MFLLLPLLVLGYVLWFNFLPFGFEYSYFLEVGSKGDMSRFSELHIVNENDVLGSALIENGKSYREFQREGQFDLIVNTPVKYGYVNLSVWYDSNSSIFVNGEKLYDSAWDDYSEVYFIDGKHIYVEKSLHEDLSNLSLEGNISEFIVNNFGKSVFVYTQGDVDLVNPNRKNFDFYLENYYLFDEVSSDLHVVDTSFRGDVAFVGYFRDSIEVELYKTDLNMYEGPENLVLIIEDLSGIQVQNFSIPDDGIVDVTKEGESNFFNFETDLKKNGVYRIKIVSIDNVGGDFEIAKVGFNSNKVMSEGEVFLTSSAKLHFKEQDSINYKYNHKRNYLFDFENRNVTVVFNPDLKGIWQTLSVAGEGYVDFYGENMWFSIDDSHFGYWEDSIFDFELLDEKIVVSSSPDLNLGNNVFLALNESGRISFSSFNGTKIYSIVVRGFKNEE